MADVTKEQVVDFLSKMSVIDMAALKTELEEKWGVKAAVAKAKGYIFQGRQVIETSQGKKVQLRFAVR